jgi:hypothetical protein
LLDVLLINIPQLNLLIFVEDEELLRLYWNNLQDRFRILYICLDNQLVKAIVIETPISLCVDC